MCDRRDSGAKDDANEMSEYSDEFSTSCDPKPAHSDDFERWQAHIGLKKFGEGLHAAAKAIFPNESRSRYSKVYVLMITWDYDDVSNLPSRTSQVDLRRLFTVFHDVYSFDVELWRIPKQGSHGETNRRILDFVKLGDDSDEHLKIVYYAGDAQLTKNGRLAWTR